MLKKKNLDCGDYLERCYLREKGIREQFVALKRAVESTAGFADTPQARSPRIRRASWISLGMMVTLLAWMAHKLVSSKRPTR